MNTYICTCHDKISASILSLFFKNPGSWFFLTRSAFEKLIYNCLFFQQICQNSYSFIFEIDNKEFEIFVQVSKLLYNDVLWINTLRIDDTWYKSKVPIPENIYFVDSSDA